MGFIVRSAVAACLMAKASAAAQPTCTPSPVAPLSRLPETSRTRLQWRAYPAGHSVYEVDARAATCMTGSLRCWQGPWRRHSDDADGAGM